MEKHFVGVLIRNSQGRLLLYKHIGKTPAWRIPGGKIEPLETPLDAIRRELREETGIDSRMVIIDPSHQTHRGFVDGDNWTGHIFRMQLPEFYQARLTEPDKCNALGWFDAAEIKELDYLNDEETA